MAILSLPSSSLLSDSIAATRTMALRKIAIRSYTWYNWLYPFSG